MRRTVTRQLAELGYAFSRRPAPRSALELLKNAETKVDLLFTDIVMPGGMNGHELARAALVDRPGAAGAVHLGLFGQRAAQWRPAAGRASNCSSKPYRKEELARKLDEVFGRADTD